MQVVSTSSFWFMRSEIYTYAVWNELTKHNVKNNGNCIDNTHTHTLYKKWIRLRCRPCKTTANILSPESIPTAISLNFCVTSHGEHTFYVLFWTVFPFHCQASLLFPPSYVPSTADEDGPDTECSSKLAQNVQAGITYYTEMYMQKNWMVQQLTYKFYKMVTSPLLQITAQCYT